MLYLLNLSFRNVFRNRRRSVLAIISVTIAVAVIVFYNGLSTGMVKSISNNLTKNETGHIQIITNGYYERRNFFPVDENIDEPEMIVSKITAYDSLNKQIDIITNRIRFYVLLNNDLKNLNALCIAGDIEKEKHLLMLQKCIIQGKYIDQSGETILGKILADNLGLSINEDLKVVTVASDGSFRMKKFKIVGIFQSGLFSLDNNVFQIPLSDGQTLLKTGAGVQQIIIMLNDYSKSQEISESISKKLKDNKLKVISWNDASDTVKAINYAEQTSNLVAFFISLLGTIIISNIMMMVIMERRKEIGLMKSLGMSKSEILINFLCEGTILGLIGSIIGVLFGTLFNIYFSFYGLNTNSFASMETRMFPMNPIIYNQVSISAIFQAVLIGILVSAIVSLLPSWRASRMNAVDSIRDI